MRLNQFNFYLSKAETLLQAQNLLSKYLAFFGFKSYAFTYYSGHVKTGRKLKYHCVSDALRPWHEHYIAQGYSDVDRTLEENTTMSLPLFWDVKLQLQNAKNKREQRIRAESIQFGIDKGLSIPIHGPNHDFVSLTLHQFCTETCLENYLEQQYEWLSATFVFHHYIKKIVDSQKSTETLHNLTRREQQCLSLTAKGWRVEKIAKELTITTHTVNFHLQNANKKLGTNNKYQAIYKLMTVL